MTVSKSLLLAIPLGSDHHWHWHRCSVQDWWPRGRWLFVHSARRNLRPRNECPSGSSLCRRPTMFVPIRWTAWCGTWTGWADGRSLWPRCPRRVACRWRHRSWRRTRAPAPAGSRRVPSRSTHRTTATGNGSAPRRSACTR